MMAVGRRSLHHQDAASLEYHLYNTHPRSLEEQAEYYRRMEEDFDTTELTQKVYAKDSESLQGWIRRLWDQ